MTKLLHAKDIKPLGTRMLVTKYKKPEKIGSLYLNPAWLVDNSRALWEVVATTPKANDYLGLEIEPGWILVTMPNRGLHSCLWDADEIYYLFAEEVVKWIPKTW